MRQIGHMRHMSAESSEGFIPRHGGYTGLLAYQKAPIVFQATCRFCERFLEKRDRTIDQMIQAARSGKQNIAEASKIWGTANIVICLIHQTNYLLDQLIPKLEKDFLPEGRLRERMLRARLAHNDKKNRRRSVKSSVV
jgi:four helix bundle suffix protein